MRQIDADKLKERIIVVYESEHNYKLVNLLFKWIDQQPTVDDWISVKDHLPKEHPSIFAPFYGTDRWESTMWRNESDRVLVTIRFPDGTRTVDKGKLQDGIWKTGVSSVLPQEVTHWAVWPEPPKEELNETHR